jgi:hypothetical protein
MAKATTPESPKMTDLRQQLRDASDFQAQQQVMLNTFNALLNNEISLTESKALNKEFNKIIKEYKTRLKEERARLKEN